jgi:glycosyltransferase involved in cell wall biosynthesis
MRNLLMIAYHFPPVKVSSGIQRTLKFASYLLNHDWQAQVLSVSPIAYETVSNDQMQEIPDKIIVKRAFALDTARHLSIGHHYLKFLALPDRWVSWCLAGTLGGLQLIVKHKPKVIFSTYPIASAHLLGLILHRLTGIPWVADFRDSMTEADYPTDPTVRRVYRWIERQTIKHCSRAVFTTPGAIRMYSERYPEIPQSRWTLIANAYDEENFIRAEHSPALAQALAEKGEALTLLHSGILYPSERDPTQFFGALNALKQAGIIRKGQFKIILRAPGHDELHNRFIQENGLEDFVFLAPSVAYETALAERLTVDGLLVFQASNCNHQIPAKIYEYLRARRPILALTDPEGDTAKTLVAAGISAIAPLDDQQAIIDLIAGFINNHQNQQLNPIASDPVIAANSRRSRAKQLAEVLNELC